MRSVPRLGEGALVPNARRRGKRQAGGRNVSSDDRLHERAHWVIHRQMRIVGGKHKGRSLIAPPGGATRPTADRARESVFNVLAHAAWSPGLDGRRVLDLFAGSGALGLEAMSRGGAFALFVETDAAARGAIRDNIEALGLFGTTRIHRRDATDLGVKPAGLGEPFDLVFLDPPYGKGLGRSGAQDFGGRRLDHGGRHRRLRVRR